MDDKPKPPRLISFKQLKDRGVLLSRREIDRREIKNEFPKRVPLGPYRSAWGDGGGRRLGHRKNCSALDGDRRAGDW